MRFQSPIVGVLSRYFIGLAIAYYNSFQSPIVGVLSRYTGGKYSPTTALIEFQSPIVGVLSRYNLNKAIST